jgi:hypothetical protein
MGGRAGGGASGGMGKGSRGGFSAAGVGRFKESDIQVQNFANHLYFSGDQAYKFPASGAWGYTVNGKILTDNKGQAITMPSKAWAEGSKSAWLKGKSMGSAKDMGKFDQTKVDNGYYLGQLKAYKSKK